MIERFRRFDRTITSTEGRPGTQPGIVRTPIAARARSALVLATCLLVVVGLLAPLGAVPAAADEPDEGWETDAEVADGMDELIETTMDEHDIAGASVSVVQDGELVHAEGYGYADAETGEPVDPEETAFMVGSVAKLMTWTAVMQGVEDGTLELDEPIETYLENHSFEGDDEVTLEHLGTHTAGYEERLEGLFVDDHDEVDDWEGKLEAEMPAQTRDSGEAIVYSNHGTGLAGLVVQEAYDEPFEDHAEERIFEPLAMEQATFDQPTDAPLSNGHVPTDDGFESTEPAIVGVPPAGSMSATATDMGNFAIAKLEGGTFDDGGEGAQLLEPESVEAMVDQRATNHPEVDGVGYGYMLSEYRGERLVWHTGGTEHFQTAFVLFPEHDAALFVSFNTLAPGLDEVVDGFMEQGLGVDAGPDREPDPTTAERAAEYEGEYRITNVQESHEKLVTLQGTRTVSVTDDGVVEVTDLLGQTSRWVEVEPGVFEPQSDEYSSFASTRMVIEDDRLYVNAPGAPFERLAWYETTTAQGAIAAAALVTLLSTVLVWPVSAYRARGWGRMREHLTRPRAAVLGCVALQLAFLAGLLANATADPAQFAYGYSPWLRLTLALLAVLAAGAVVVLALVGLEWKRVLEARGLEGASTNGYGLAYLTALTVALLALLWQLWYWNLLTAAF